MSCVAILAAASTSAIPLLQHLALVTLPTAPTERPIFGGDRLQPGSDNAEVPELSFWSKLISVFFSLVVKFAISLLVRQK